MKEVDAEEVKYRLERARVIQAYQLLSNSHDSEAAAQMLKLLDHLELQHQLEGK